MKVIDNVFVFRYRKPITKATDHVVDSSFILAAHDAARIIDSVNVNPIRKELFPGAEDFSRQLTVVQGSFRNVASTRKKKEAEFGVYLHYVHTTTIVSLLSRVMYRIRNSSLAVVPHMACLPTANCRIDFLFRSAPAFPPKDSNWTTISKFWIPMTRSRSRIGPWSKSCTWKSQSPPVSTSRNFGATPCLLPSAYSPFFESTTTRTRLFKIAVASRRLTSNIRINALSAAHSSPSPFINRSMIVGAFMCNQATTNTSRKSTTRSWSRTTKLFTIKAGVHHVLNKPKQ